MVELAVETRRDLKEDRDNLLLTRWIIKRLNAEKTANAVVNDPDIPASMLQDLNWEIDLLDRFIPIGIQRARDWGREGEAIDATRMLEILLVSVHKTVDPGGAVL